jgi:glucan 1,3-beta-glucosidase
MAPPTNDTYTLSQVVNIKNVSGFPVAGDGVTDDTASLNSILQKYTGYLLYFPAGTCLVTDTLFFVPSGT